MVDCQAFSERRFKCHAVYGKLGEDCIHEELSEKRCLSLKHCPLQAKEYYGGAAMTNIHDEENPLSRKALCASWAEAFFYAPKELEFGADAAGRHQRAREIVQKDRALKQDCRAVAMRLAECLRHKQLFAR